MFLVTGGAGFIGSHLVGRLLRDGHEVRVLDNFSTGKPERLAAVRGEIDLIEGDLRDPAAVRRAVRGAATVLHQAADPSVPRSITNPQTTIDINVSGTLHLLQAAAEEGCRRVVFASTCAVYGDAARPPTAETALPRPLSPYAVSKLAAEHLGAGFSQLHGVEFVSLRYFNVFGPGQDPASAYAAAIPRFIAALESGTPPVVFGDGEQTRDFVHIDDVVAANLLAATVAGVAGGVFNIGSGRSTSIKAVLSTLQRLLGTDIPVSYQPARDGEVRHSLADIGEARGRLGYDATVPFEEGVARLLGATAGRPGQPA